VKPKPEVLDRCKRSLNRAQDEGTLQHGELMPLASKIIEKLSFVDVISLCSASVMISNGEKVCRRDVVYNISKQREEKKMGAGALRIFVEELQRVQNRCIWIYVLKPKAKELSTETG
jgi:hypothetical protein